MILLLLIYTAMLQRRNHSYSYILSFNLISRTAGTVQQVFLLLSQSTASYPSRKTQEEQNSTDETSRDFRELRFHGSAQGGQNQIQSSKGCSLPSIDPPLTPLPCRSAESKDKTAVKFHLQKWEEEDCQGKW